MWRIPSDVSQFKSSVSRGFWTEFFSILQFPLSFLAYRICNQIFLRRRQATADDFRCDRVTTTWVKESRRSKIQIKKCTTPPYPCTLPQHGSLIKAFKNEKILYKFFIIIGTRLSWSLAVTHKKWTKISWHSSKGKNQLRIRPHILSKTSWDFPFSKPQLQSSW
jgi:hypothetical protein